FEVPYPYPSSGGVIFNWQYSVPFELGPRASVPRKADVLHFLLHLRFARQIFAYRGLEEQVVWKLDAILNRDRVTADIHTGLGWSDVLVNGRLASRSLDDLVRRLVNIHSFRVTAAGKPFPVIARMLSLVGYEPIDGEDPPLLVNGRHITIARV